MEFTLEEKQQFGAVSELSAINTENSWNRKKVSKDRRKTNIILT